MKRNREEHVLKGRKEEGNDKEGEKRRRRYWPLLGGRTEKRGEKMEEKKRERWGVEQRVRRRV